ncbi:hypothetical protein N0V93_004071 [Gnomoniopsis smithogilvyi]|uniref:Extradiol ring-cleavage dioxygenase class III enzyme subunit B domain-containing protein n=1 Tax=Gnomoniopsis smithogilvyi TaxID=1191159 RepID=A0A9W8YZS1_9PEZI|nr:hypothetical protein N0V93_004071 [Gnomoniopsis smithogilvyi]
MPRGAVVSVSHGGGPMPVLGDPGHAELVKSLREKVPGLLRLGTPSAPRAIVVVTAHWSTVQPTVSSGASHRLYYDYGGFPKEAYSLKYPAPGEPEVAKEVKKVLDGVGFQTELNPERGWDHGVFIPFLLINPAANVPIVQVSVLRSEDPAAHLRMGRALGQLRDSNIAIVGSGFASFHNMQLMMALMMGGDGGEVASASKAFNAAVTEAVTGEEKEEGQREKALEGWRGSRGVFDASAGRGGAFLAVVGLLWCGRWEGEGVCG